eukprot:403365857
MSVEQLKTYVQAQKDKYDSVRQQNSDFNEKLHRQMRKESRMREEQKQAVLQAETVNMMTKYQLVFVKMENQFAKIFNSNKLRNLRFKQDAFIEIKMQALVRDGDVQYRTHQVYEKVRNHYVQTLIIDKYQAKQLKVLHLALQKWKTFALIPRLALQAEESNAKDMENLKQKLSLKEREVSEKELLVKQKESQFKQMISEYKRLQLKIEDQEGKERQISQEIQSLIYKNTTSAVENQKGVSHVFQRAQQLEQSLQQLKRENKALREKLEMTEFNMQSFIREMGGMLDQHQLIDTIGDLMNEQFPLNNPGSSNAGGGSSLGVSSRKPDEEGGGSTGGSIRRNK